MANNKVIYGGNTLIDLTADTVIADALRKGYTAHGADGNQITGTYEDSGSSNVRIVTGTFTTESTTSAVTVTFDEELDSAPSLVFFYEVVNSSNLAIARTKAAIGSSGEILFHTGTAPTQYKQARWYSTTKSTNSVAYNTYAITTTATSITSSYPCIRNATKTGFKAYPYASSYPLLGTYNYIALCL